MPHYCNVLNNVLKLCRLQLSQRSIFLHTLYVIYARNRTVSANTLVMFGFNAIFSPQQFQQFDGGSDKTVLVSDSCFASLGFCSWFIRFVDIRFVPIITWTKREFWNVFKYIHGWTESIIKCLYPVHRISRRVCSRFTLSPPLVLFVYL